MSDRSPWVCPACGVGCAPHVDCCPNCAAKQAFKPQPAPPTFPIWPPAQPWPYPLPNYPGTAGTWTLGERKCAFDGLPPGVYGLYCGCPKCSPTFIAPNTTITLPSVWLAD